MEHQCLYCYQPIDTAELKTEAGRNGYHPSCSRKFFGKEIPPTLGFTQSQITDLAENVIKSQKSVTGVQPKLSLGLSESSETIQRFTIVGLWGEYILKPQSAIFTNLPENEDLCMHLAQISKLKTASHALIRLKSGELSYITKRIDREGGKKLHMEDMCQLTERLTEHKYRGSHEQIAKTIQQYSANPGLDIVNFYELVLFSFLTGNNDMHLKNFSMLKSKKEYNLCPAYDLVASALVVEEDKEELALTLNAKKNKIRKADFEIAMDKAGIDQKVIENVFIKFTKLIPKWLAFIDYGFIPSETKKSFKELILLKANQLNLDIKVKE